MARIINVEKSKYLNANIEKYTANKVGQYSKYLDKNPIFVTYFHINTERSRTDVGTGGVNADLGPKSPLRFNQINNLPVYNIPELKPNPEYAENGYDIELELNDITLLPNTIKPIPGDYLLLQLPNTIEFLFRINEFQYNTIQSNDFYQFSADLKFTGENLIQKLESQIVAVYETIFENIGTDDKCFILSSDVDKIETVGKFFLEMKEMYYANFFDTLTGNFVCKNNDRFINPEDHEYDDSWFYDPYVEKFIMDSEMYFVDNDEHTIAVVPGVCDAHVDYEFKRTLGYGLLNHTVDYMADYPYFFRADIQKPLSTFRINRLNCKATNLVLTKQPMKKGNSDALDSGYVYEYYSHKLISELKGKSISEEDEVEETRDVFPYTYLDTMILQYMMNQTLDIDRQKILPYLLSNDSYSYLMIPLVMYVVKKYYDSYFTKTEL